MSDKELLELAAKAAGIEGEWSRWHQSYGDLWVEGLNTGGPILWNPLNIETGDALRLAVKLKMFVDIGDHFSEAAIFVDDKRIGAEVWHQNYTPEEATCRAILRAAAEIGRGME